MKKKSPVTIAIIAAVLSIGLSPASAQIFWRRSYEQLRQDEARRLQQERQQQQQRERQNGSSGMRQLGPGGHFDMRPGWSFGGSGRD